MNFDGNHAPEPLSFEIWKQKLRKDCELHDKLLAFDNLGEATLHLLWKEGLDPNVAAIIANA